MAEGRPELAWRLPGGLRRNERLRMDGRRLLDALPAGSVSAVFFDPQYRGVLDHLGYGNEGESRGHERCALAQMSEETIREFVVGCSRVLADSGHLFLWVDKFHLMENSYAGWADGLPLSVVDMITWDKGRMGMGYRSRRQSEYLVVVQKFPKRAKGVWQRHNIPDVWNEKVPRPRNGDCPHPKPVGLQSALIEAVTSPGDWVADPAAGSFSVLDACAATGRTFVGCDLNG